MKIDDDLFNRLAKLSKLSFEGTEKEAIKKDLQHILNFIDQINEVDTKGVEPLIHITNRKNAFREDEAKQLITKEEALSNAPNKTQDFFLVPKVIKK